MKQSRITPYLGDRAFYQVAFMVMIPVMLQQLTNAVFGFIDSTMMAHIDEFSLSAVSVANKPSIIFTAMFMGFAGAACLLIAQYHGADRMDICQRIFSIELLIGVGFSLIFSLVLLMFPEQIMRLFVKDPYTVDIGIQYLRLLAWTYLPTSFSLVCLYSLRALGITFLPMLVTFLTIAANLLFEWALIFGKFNLPQMGVRGAALGTLLARLLEMSIYVWVLLRHKTPFRLTFAPVRRIGKSLMRDYVHKALPLTLNELLWSSGQILFFWVYAHVSESSLPAINVSDQVLGVSWVLFMGISGVVSVQVGRQLGANQFTAAKANAKRLYGLALMLSVVCMITAFVLSHLLGVFFPKLSHTHIALAKQLILMYLCFFPFNMVYVLSFQLLQSGGDIKHATLLDSVYTWMLPASIALLIVLFFPGRIGIFNMVLVMQILSCLKVFWALRIIKRGTWLNNLTRT